MGKCYTDVRKFVIPGSSKKLYLSLILDNFNSEIIAYNLSTPSNLSQVKAIFNKILQRNSAYNSMMETFFGILKSEMFYDSEKTFNSIK